MFDKIYNWIGFIVTTVISFLYEQLNWIKAIFQEDNKASFRRVSSMMVIVLFIRSYTQLVIKSDKLPEVPETWLVIILVLTGFSSILTAISMFMNKQVPQTETKKDDTQN